MPELPEVETIRRSLEKDIVGKQISGVHVHAKKMFIGTPSVPIGAKIIKLTRWAKVLTLVLNNNHFVNIHLKMSGELLFAKQAARAVFKKDIPRSKSNKLPNKHTRIILEFHDKSALFFNDLRRFGWMKVTKSQEKYKSPDVLSSDFTIKYLDGVLKKTSRPIKIVLMDQEKMGGIGNIYANDSLWQARIHPKRPAKSLKEKEIKNLHGAILAIIQEAIRYKGSSAKDEMYVLPDGEKGQYQNHLKVYHRTGKPCIRCRTKLESMRLGGRGTFFCPSCQN